MNRCSLVSRMKICGWLVGASMAFVAARPLFAQEDLIELVLGFLGDEDKEVRALAFEQIRTEAKGEQATKQFAAQLPRLSSEAQIGLLSALADRGDQVAGPAVVELLNNSSDLPVRLAAIQAIGHLGQPADHVRLIKILTGGSKAEQSAARDALVRLGDNSVSTEIAGKLSVSPQKVHVALLEILTTRRAIGATPQMLASTVVEDAVVRSAAMAALGKLAGPEHVAGMINGVLKAERGREREAAEKAVAMVCQRIEDINKRAEPVLAARKKLGQSDQMIVLSTLGRVGGVPALKVVEEAIANADPAAHEMGLRALCNWPDASVVGRLLELARIEMRPEHRRMALRALIRVATLSDKRTDGHRLDVLRTAIVMSRTDSERDLVLQRAQAIRTIESLRFIQPYLSQPTYAERACLTVVELAHHRKLREPNKAEFDKVLDQVIATTENAVIIDRAKRYKKDQTWVRPGAK